MLYVAKKVIRRKWVLPPLPTLFVRQLFNGAHIWRKSMKYANSFRKIQKRKRKWIYYTTLFCSCGIGEYYLKKLGLYPGVAVELDPKRAQFFQEMYPECHVIVGDIWDPAVFNEAIEWHKKMNCVGTMSSCPCQSYQMPMLPRILLIVVDNYFCPCWIFSGLPIMSGAPMKMSHKC